MSHNGPKNDLKWLSPQMAPTLAAGDLAVDRSGNFTHLVGCELIFEADVTDGEMPPLRRHDVQPRHNSEVLRRCLRCSPQRHGVDCQIPVQAPTIAEPIRPPSPVIDGARTAATGRDRGDSVCDALNGNRTDTPTEAGPGPTSRFATYRSGRLGPATDP